MQRAAAGTAQRIIVTQPEDVEPEEYARQYRESAALALSLQASAEPTNPNPNPNPDPNPNPNPNQESAEPTNPHPHPNPNPNPDPNPNPNPNQESAEPRTPAKRADVVVSAPRGVGGGFIHGERCVGAGCSETSGFSSYAEVAPVDFVSRLLAQCTAQPGLSRVYAEIFEQGKGAEL